MTLLLLLSSIAAPFRLLFVCFSACGRDPADTGAAGLGQDRDLSDLWNIEDRPHQLGACGFRLLHPRVDIVDRQVRHPAVWHACELRTIGREDAGDRLAVLDCEPISRA